MKQFTSNQTQAKQFKDKQIGGETVSGKGKAFKYLETKKNQVEREKKRAASMKHELNRTELALKRANRTIETLRGEVLQLNKEIELQRSVIEDLTDTAVGGDIYCEHLSDLQVGYNFG